MNVIIENTWNDYGEADDIIQYCEANNIKYQILPATQIVILDNFFDNIFFCNTEIVLEKLKQVNFADLCPDTYDSTYNEFYHRLIEKINISDIIITDSIFIKPVENNKLFNGHIVLSQLDVDSLAYADPKMMVYKSNVINIMAEYRLLMGNGKLYGHSYMKGCQIDNYLNKIDINKLIGLTGDKFRCIDVGFTDETSWLIVEINPMYSLDSYNIDIKDYMEFCIDSCKFINKCVRSRHDDTSQ